MGHSAFWYSYLTTDHILTINLLVEKCREWNLPLYIIFADFKKIFDYIEFKVIWTRLEHFNVNPETARIIKQFYSASKFSLVIANELCEFNIRRWVLQGNSLFSLLLVLTLQLALNGVIWCNRGNPINDKRLQHLIMPKYIALISNNANKLQTMLNDFITEC